MELRYSLVTPPTAEPVSTADVRTFLKIDDDDTSADTTINILIASAREYAEKYTGRSLMPRTWVAVADSFPGCWLPPAPFSAYAYGSRFSLYEHHADDSVIKIGRGPVNSITSITYVDTNGATQTLDPSTYILDTSDLVQRVAPAFGSVWPVTRRQLGAVRITFKAGYALDTATTAEAQAAISATVRNWMFVRIATAYGHPEEEEIVAKGKLQPLAYVDGLLDSEKVWSL